MTVDTGELAMYVTVVSFGLLFSFYVRTVSPRNHHVEGGVSSAGLEIFYSQNRLRLAAR